MANREAGKEDDPMLYAPGNIKRVIQNALRQFQIDKGLPSDLHPKDVIEKINAIMRRLVVVVGDDVLSVEAQNNATTLYRILIRSYLASKRVLKEYRLSEAALNWVFGEIESRFRRSRSHSKSHFSTRTLCKHTIILFLELRTLSDPLVKIKTNAHIFGCAVWYCTAERGTQYVPIT